MRLTIETADLNAGISIVSRALATKTTLSILEGVYIEAAECSLLLKCTDLSLQIETRLPAVIEQEGAAVLPGRLFSDMVRRLPGEVTTIFSEGKATNIESGRAKTSIQGEDANDYHDMQDVKKAYSIKIEKRALKDMIRQCVFATAQDESKPILTGVLLELEGESLSMVALDGYRLALRKEGVGMGGEARSAVIPAKSLLEISRVLDDGEGQVEMVFSDTHVMLDMEHTRIKARLLEGEFIKYRQILPDKHSTRVRVDRAEMLASIERVSLMAREGRTNLIKFAFEGGLLNISANSELGRSNEELEVHMTGSDLEIAFNAKYFSDVLKALDDQEIYLEMNNNISPCVIKPTQGEAFYYLILPVRLFTGV